MDLPPGHRGYGSDERIEMEASVEEYNEGVLDSQSAEGRLESTEAMGSKLRRYSGGAA